jgi:hypothetical protein
LVVITPLRLTQNLQILVLWFWLLSQLFGQQ